MVVLRHVGTRWAKLLSGFTFKIVPRDTSTVPAFTPRGFRTYRACVQ